MPAYAGIQVRFVPGMTSKDWIPACAGMTEKKVDLGVGITSGVHLKILPRSWGGVST